jgi:hypothetical protein
MAEFVRIQLPVHSCYHARCRPGVADTEYNGQNTREWPTTELVAHGRVDYYMANKLRFGFVLCAGFAALMVGGPLAISQPAWAQERGSRDGDSRGDWRERYRNRGGEGDRGRDSRGGDSRGDWRGGRSRDEERKSDSSSSSSRSTPSSSSSSSSSDSKPSSSSSSGSSSSMNYSEYAKGLVKQYDKNGDSMLQADEQKELRGRAAEADDNKDGTITIDELVSHLSSGSSSTPSPTSSSSSDSMRRHDGDKSKSDSDKSKRVLYGSVGGPAGPAKEGEKQRRTYRFTPATQKLPTGLPGWFTSKDANHDGQVSMSEYGKSWTERSVADYQKIDVNNDGVITPKEASKAPSGG